MRVFALSDLHAGYPENLNWILQLSNWKYQNDVLVLAGDVTDRLRVLVRVLNVLRSKFKELLFVPRNHDLWVDTEDLKCSIEKFGVIASLCKEEGVKQSSHDFGELTIVPMFSWYDFSFGEPDRHLRRALRDFKSCVWPANLPDVVAVNQHFL